MAKYSMTKGGMIKNKGSKSASFIDRNTGKSSYVDSSYIPRSSRSKTPVVESSKATAPSKPESAGSSALEELKGELGSIQNSLNESVASGEVESATKTEEESVPSPDEYYNRYTPPESAEEEPTQSAEQIQRDMMRNAQREINELHDYENTLLAEQNTINQSRNRETQSVNTLTGLGGSDEANANVKKTDQQNQQANRVITDQVSVKVQGILSDIRTAAITEAREQRTEARLDAETKEKNRITRMTEAQTHIATLASVGATLEGMKKTDPEGYEYLSRQVGGEGMVKAMFTLNRPKESIVERRFEGNKMIQIYNNPLTGEDRIETVDIPGMPVGYSKTLDAGDRILAVPDDWDGDPSKLITINKGLTPGQTQSGSGGTDGNKLLSISEAQTLGVPYGTTVAQAVALGKTPQGKVTGSQNDNLGFYNRGKDALDNVNKVEQAIADQGLVGDIQLQTLPGWAQTKDQQLYRQAQRQFTEARLRKESGAAIPNAEYTTDAETYFAQPGDTAETLAQKKAARESVLDSLAVASGPAYTDYYGQEYTPNSKGGNGVLTSPDGTQEVNVADLTPEEVQEAKDNGWD